MISNILVIFSLAFLARTAHSEAVRLCVAEIWKDYCQKMEEDAAGDLRCITARDKMECMEFVKDGKADLINLDPEELYVAGKNHALVPVVMEEFEGALYRYRPGAVIPKTSSVKSLQDLKGVPSCHTGLGRTAGWNVPLGILLSQNVMKPDCHGEIATMEAFFGGSCVPGNWSSDAYLDQELKQLHKNLCSICKGPQLCGSEGEPYKGYHGAMQCLLDGAGQVAFTKIESAQEFFRSRLSQADQYQFLCMDGSRTEVLSKDPCFWLKKPTNVFAGLQGANRVQLAKKLQELLMKFAVSKPSWFGKSFVGAARTTGLLPVPEDQQTVDSYLGNYKLTIEKVLPGCPPMVIKQCVASAQELQKCQDFQAIAYAKRIRPQIVCVQSGPEGCARAVQAGEADFVTLDGGNVYRSGRQLGLRPVASEQYGQEAVSYYAVAVVHANSTIRTLEDLRGKKSCHTRYGRNAGWNVPLGVLRKKGLLSGDACNLASSLASFFSASCVPGANDPKFNPNLDGVDVLCSLCIGDKDGQNRCNPDERYSGYAGSFRCLAEGAGDVTFVNHRVVPENTDGQGKQEWNANLKSSDYRLMCLDGTQKDVRAAKECNWASIPFHQVMIAGDAPESTRRRVALALLWSSSSFGPTSATFKLFSPYKGMKNLLFRDGTTSLKALPKDLTYRDVLNREYLDIMEQVDPTLC